MNRQIKILLTASFWLFMFSFSASGQALKVQIHNKTGQHVDSLIIGKTSIGNLAKDSATVFLDFQQFHFDSGHPDEDISGLIQKIPAKQLEGRHCTTSLHTETSGKY